MWFRRCAKFVAFCLHFFCVSVCAIPSPSPPLFWTHSGPLLDLICPLFPSTSDIIYVYNIFHVLFRTTTIIRTRKKMIAVCRERRGYLCYVTLSVSHFHVYEIWWYVRCLYDLIENKKRVAYFFSFEFCLVFRYYFKKKRNIVIPWKLAFYVRIHASIHTTQTLLPSQPLNHSICISCTEMSVSHKICENYDVRDENHCNVIVSHGNKYALVE